MSERNFCERCGKRISALEWDIHTCTPPAQPQQEQAYKSVNPLGGPAKVFDAMANAIRAGDAYHAVLRQYGFTEAQPQQEPVALHAMAKRRIFDAIRSAYDLGYNDARNARTTPGDSAPGYKGRDVEADHGGALICALERYTTPPAAQPAVALTDEQIHIRYKAMRGDTPPRYIEIYRDCEAAHGIKENA